MEKLRAFIKVYADELQHKVTWPTFPELQSHTITVLVACLIIAVVIALIDLVFNRGMSFLYELMQTA